MGIDVSEETIDISVQGEHSKIKNNKTAVKNFIKTKTAKIDITLCVLESTGGYERLVITLLNEAGIKVHRAHPNKVHAFAKAGGHFAKTDRLDSKSLEKYAKFIQDDKYPCIELNKELLELQSLRSVEISLEKELHAQQCRVKLLTGAALTCTNKHIVFIKKQLVKIGEEIEKIITKNQELVKKQKILTNGKGVGKKTADS